MATVVLSPGGAQGGGRPWCSPSKDFYTLSVKGIEWQRGRTKVKFGIWRETASFTLAALVLRALGFRTETRSKREGAFPFGAIFGERGARVRGGKHLRYTWRGHLAKWHRADFP